MVRFRVTRKEIWETEVFIDDPKIITKEAAQLAVYCGDGEIENDSKFKGFSLNYKSWVVESLESDASVLCFKSFKQDKLGKKSP